MKVDRWGLNDVGDEYGNELDHRREAFEIRFSKEPESYPL